MSFHHINFVRDHSKAKGPARFVLWAIASRIGEDGCCYPSYQCLARDTKLSLRTIARAIKQIPSNELEILEQGGSPKDEQRRSTRYRLIIPDRSHTDYSLNGNRSQPDHSTVVTESIVQPTTVVSHDTDRSQPDYLTDNKQKKEQKRSRASPGFPEIPLLLNTPDFLKAWSDFDHYRREGKKKKEWTARAKQIALESCLKFGKDRAIEAINHSILNGWTGIYERNNNNQPPKPARSVDEFGLPKL